MGPTAGLPPSPAAKPLLLAGAGLGARGMGTATRIFPSGRSVSVSRGFRKKAGRCNRKSRQSTSWSFAPRSGSAPIH
jgi:hypothetical protein